MTREELDLALKVVTAFAPIVTGICGLIGAGATVFVAYRVMGHTAVTGRYKTSLEAYKIAKEAGLTTEADEVWARRSLRLLADDAEQHAQSTDFSKLLRKFAVATFFAYSANLYSGIASVLVWTMTALMYMDFVLALYRSVTVDVTRWKAVKGKGMTNGEKLGRSLCACIHPKQQKAKDVNDPYSLAPTGAAS